MLCPFPKLRLVTLAAAVALVAAAPARAQTVGGGADPGNAGAGPAPRGAAKAPTGKAEQKAENVKIPAAVLSGLLVGAPEAMLALKQYLAAVAGSPELIATRALDVVAQLKNSGLVRDPALLVAAAERVSRSVKETLGSAKIVQLKIDRNYKPPAKTIALDFAPPDAKVRPGFQRVLANDKMLKGDKMQAIRRPGDDADLLADGIAGVEELELELPDGEYRVTLMTESLGDAATSLSPFGQKIMANGEQFDILQATPDAWLNQAVLSNKGLAGFNTATERQGGAVTVTVRVQGGKLKMGFNLGDSGAGLKTYLTGMLVEPADQVSSLTVVPDVAEVLSTSAETRTRYESQLASSLSTLLEDINPGAGPSQLQDDLLQPVQTVEQTSPN